MEGPAPYRAGQIDLGRDPGVSRGALHPRLSQVGLPALGFSLWRWRRWWTGSEWLSGTVERRLSLGAVVERRLWKIRNGGGRIVK